MKARLRAWIDRRRRRCKPSRYWPGPGQVEVGYLAWYCATHDCTWKGGSTECPYAGEPPRLEMSR